MSYFFFFSAGIVPETMEEWMLLIQLCQHRNSTNPSTGISHLSSDSSTCPSIPSTVNGTSADSCVDNTNGKVRDVGPVDLINGSADWSSRITVEKLVLCLARIVGPDRALAALQEHGVHLELNTHSTLVCELLRVAEKRQR